MPCACYFAFGLGEPVSGDNFIGSIGDLVPAGCNIRSGIVSRPEMRAFGPRNVGGTESARSRTKNCASRCLVAGEVYDARTDEARIQARERLFGQYAFGHLSGGGWSEAIDSNTVFLALDRQRLRQSDERHLGRAVIGLPK